MHETYCIYIFTTVITIAINILLCTIYLYAFYQGLEKLLVKVHFLLGDCSLVSLSTVWLSIYGEDHMLGSQLVVH